MTREALVQEIVESMAKCQRPANLTDWQKIGLSRAQIGMLYMLSYHKQLQIKQIALSLGTSKSAASQLIEPLVAKGLVSRQTDRKDRRAANLKLTTVGNNTLKKVNKLKYDNLRSRLQVLSPKELEQMAALYRKLAVRANK